MSEDPVQISAYVSKTTKARLDEFARESGLKKGYIIEQAIGEFLSTAEVVPPEMQIPTRIVLTNESFDQVLDMINNPPEPTEALKALLKGL
ncbi:MAG: hypothetical protein C0418_04625 [Coriobacteriaceae bacterium]|nr:hypothetical protein [Coriobacteriaceae bacterium]